MKTTYRKNIVEKLLDLNLALQHNYEWVFEASQKNDKNEFERARARVEHLQDTIEILNDILKAGKECK